MTCEEAEELLGAYVLGALPPDERQAVRTHLATCSQPHASLRDLLEVVDLLPYACEELEPDPVLGQRIRAAATVERERIQPAASPPEPIPAGRPRPARRRNRWLTASAGAAVLAALGLGLLGLAQHQALSRQVAANHADEALLALLANGATVYQAPAANSSSGQLLVQPRDGSPAYLWARLPHAPADRTYHVWLTQRGTVTSAGVFNGSNDGSTLTRLTGALNGAELVAVTIEPRGSVLPTGPEVIRYRLP